MSAALAECLPDYKITGYLRQESGVSVVLDAIRSDGAAVLVELWAVDPDGDTSVRIHHGHQKTQGQPVPCVAGLQEVRRCRAGVVVIRSRPPGAPLDLGHRIDLGRALELLVAITKLVVTLHGRGQSVDLRPGKIFLDGDTVHLCGPGVPACLQVELSDLHAPQLLQHVLPFIAPEQTDRLRCTIDSRASLYCLGIIAHKLITGEAAFDAKDALSLIHAHLAVRPRGLRAGQTSLPGALTHIVARLLHKAPEHRYQTAKGVLHDLQICLDGLREHGTVPRFEIGSRDRSDLLQLPHHLYGRSESTTTLNRSIERVCEGGQPEVVGIEGEAGVGKTALIEQAQYPIAEHHGLLVSGKFEQLERNEAYGALTRGFDGLIRRILTQTDAEVARWRTRLADALGDSASVISEAIPSMAALLGPQLGAPAGGAIEAQNRFERTFEKMVGALAGPEHPLVLFLDDLQWADPRSLDLVRQLLIAPQIRFLVLIGAFRTEETGAGHPLRLTLQSIAAGGRNVVNLHLGRLPVELIESILRDTLHTDSERLGPFARVVHDKTRGNPFFVHAFLRSAATQGLLRMNEEGWTWDIEEIRRSGAAKNVVSLLAAQLRGLPTQVADVLRHAAALGSEFDLDALAQVMDRPRQQVLEDLEPALAGGMLQERREGFRFVHDRVQEAALSLTPMEDRAALRLQVGRRLASLDKREYLLDIAGHLVSGLPAIREDSDRIRAAALLFAAGRRSRKSAAFEPAWRFFAAAARVLPPPAWDAHYYLTIAIHLELSQAEYSSGRFESSTRHFEMLVQQARHPRYLARAFSLRIVQAANQGQWIESVALGLEAMNRLGVPMPDRVAAEDVRAIYTESARQLAAIPDKELLDVKGSRRGRDRIALYCELISPFYVARQDLYQLLVVRLLRESLINSDPSYRAWAYACYAIAAGTVMSNYRESERFARLASELTEQVGVHPYACKLHFIIGGMLMHWYRPVEEQTDVLLESYRAGLESGDLLFAGYSVTKIIFRSFSRGQPLPAVREELDRYRPFLERSQSPLLPVVECVADIISTLERPDSHEPSSGLEVRTRLDALRDSRFDYGVHVVTLYLGQLSLVFGEWSAALDWMDESAATLVGASGQLSEAEHWFLYGWAAARGEQHGLLERQEALLRVDAAFERMTRWRKGCERNFAHYAEALRAEKARLQDDLTEAQQAYDLAFDAARDEESWCVAGLVAEAAAELLDLRGRHRMANGFREEAKVAYERWGAVCKVSDLTRQTANPIAMTPTRPASEAVDLATLFKAAQAISEALDVRGVVRRLLSAAAENAGAQRGVLVTLTGGATVRADLTVEQDYRDFVSGLPLAEAHDLVPQSIIRYVSRTGETVVLANASTRGQFQSDPYIRAHNIRSVIALPVLRRTTPSAVLYLENNLTDGAFAKQRLELLSSLVALASTALENAGLYEDLGASEARFRAIFEKGGDAVFILDHATGAVLQKNEAAVLLLERLDVPSPAALTESLAGTRMGKEGSQSVEYPDREGRPVHLLSDTRRIELDGRPIRLVTARDITELRQLERQLVQAQKMEAVGQLAGGIAHDFNNILVSILGYTEMLQEDMDPESSAAEDLAEVHKAGQRAAELTRRLLLFSRKEVAEPRPVDLEAVVDDVGVMIKRLIGEDISLRRERSGEPLVVHADPGQLEQIVVNLAVNARDAMPNGGTLTLVTKRGPSGPMLVVRDTGVGIEPELRARIFEPFFTTKERGRGTGLGLAMVYGVVHGVGGWVDLDSTLGKGTEFHLHFPPSAPDSSTFDVPVQARPKGGSESVLVVEDEEPVRRLMVSVLKHYGYRVSAAASVEEARQRLREGLVPELIVSDVIMSGERGTALLDQGQLPPDVPFLFVSGYTDDEMVRRGVSTRTLQFLQKPFTAHALATKVRRILDRGSSAAKVRPGLGDAAPRAVLAPAKPTAAPQRSDLMADSNPPKGWPSRPLPEDED